MAANNKNDEAAPGERQEQLHEQPIGDQQKQHATEKTTLGRQELDLA